MQHENVVALKRIIVENRIYGQLESLEDREICLVLERSVQFFQFVVVGLIARTFHPKPVLLKCL